MPIPDEVRPPAPNQTRIEFRIDHPAKPKKREAKILIASNLGKKQNEVVISRRHYRFALPSDWTMYNDSYKGGSNSTDELPGKIEVQFVSPAKVSTVIIFTYSGRSIGKEPAAFFHQI